jgi:DNA-binding FrmR family transcriptional regulator
MVQESSAKPAAPGYHADLHALVNRLRRIEGQVRGLQRMVEAEAYCIDILTQVSAVTKALQNVAVSLLDDHLRHCVTDAARLSPGGRRPQARGGNPCHRPTRPLLNNPRSAAAPKPDRSPAWTFRPRPALLHAPRWRT